MRLRALLVAAFSIAGGTTALAVDLHAQTLGCGFEEICEVADAAVTVPARLAITAAGGNPVPGTASTLGMRVPGSPRWSIALRGTVARAQLPPVGGSDLAATFWSIGADASIGLFNGFMLLPTIGGFGSVDALASAGLLRVPEGDGFETDSPLTWALGARVGILRESFTAPGVSVSAMFRSLPDLDYARDSTVSFANDAQSVMTYRATVGKRILGLGLTAGIAHDRGSSEVSGRLVDQGWLLEHDIGPGEVSFNRTSFFGNVSYTLLILNMAAELGWQEDGDRPAGAHEDTGKGGLFGGIAVRLAI
ncbi:MAG TPA: hypothetical protein VHG09_00125 [Longimicrobiales bacterium]|nr:hypothetical protein [Longimicrobiales bacterium]